MLLVSGIISLDPADHDKAVAAVGPLVATTLAEEGNITYGFWAHPTDRGTFRVYEEWRDQAAIDEHFASPHMAEFMAVMAGLAVTGTDIYSYQASERTKIM